MRIRPGWCGTEEVTRGRLIAVPTAGTGGDASKQTPRGREGKDPSTRRFGLAQDDSCEGRLRIRPGWTMEGRLVRRAVEDASPYGDGGWVGIRPGDTSRVWIGARGGIRGCLPTAGTGRSPSSVASRQLPPLVEAQSGRLIAAPTAWRETANAFCHGFSFLYVRSKLHFFAPSFSPVSDMLDFCQVRGQFFLERYALMRYYKPWRIISGASGNGAAGLLSRERAG